MPPGVDLHGRPFVATYRLQLSPAFTFGDACEAAPYIARLGASHLYLSPVWECVPDSSHGYDVVDHAAFRSDIGGAEGFQHLRDTADRLGLGIIVDVVPNHVGVAEGRHPWWRDVLRFGPESPFAPYFDIDWEGQPQLPSNVLVVPVLGQPFGEALEAGELSLEFDGGELVLRYFDKTFPIWPVTYAAILGQPPAGAAHSRGEAAAFAEAEALVEELVLAPPGRAREMVRELAALLEANPAVRGWVERQLASFAGEPDEPRSWDALDEVLALQPYRLAYWRVSGEEINYRRFFDINELAAVRQEHLAVFEATHRLVGELAREGAISGLRVDHIDGLYDPARYLEALASLSGERPAPVWVEKILAPGEELPDSWRVAGTTGYDFLAEAGGLFIDPAGEAALTAAYREFTGQFDSFPAIAWRARMELAEESFPGEVNVLANQLYRLAQRDRRFRDVTLSRFRQAIVALLASFPVYRTYLEDQAPREVDRDLVGQARTGAFSRQPHLAREAVDFLCRVLLLDSDRLSANERERWLHFRRRFQQISGPLMAKGVEDTSFYRYNRLLALNEVGAHPDHFATPPAAFHAWCAARARSSPLGLSATSTHDTKRSEDARMRLSVLSELAPEWRREVRAWSRLNDRHRTRRGASGAWPERNTEYYLYQSLVASYEGEAADEYVERIAGHMQKAAREAKVHTSWTNIAEEYEAALDGFVRAVLDPRRSGRFLGRLERWVRRIEPTAAINGLALTALKVLAPGVPDIYQGCEFRTFSLTDPDNRRPVDFQAAANALDRLGERPPCALDRLAKPWLLQRLLQLRRRHHAALAEGTYEVLDVSGENGGRVLAFARVAGDTAVLAAVPRLVARLATEDGRLTFERGTARLELPAGYRWRDEIGGRVVVGGELDISALLAAFPVVVLAGERA